MRFVFAVRPLRPFLARLALTGPTLLMATTRHAAVQMEILANFRALPLHKLRLLVARTLSALAFRSLALMARGTTRCVLIIQVTAGVLVLAKVSRR